MIIFLLFSSILIFLFHELYWKRRNYPPGPIPLPFIGNTYLLSRGFEIFIKWKKDYGDVYTFWAGSIPYVMINSYEKMKETFIRDGDTYVDKKPQEFQEKIRGGYYGVVETNGEVWRDHRRFALTNLRDLGLGKDLMQEKILIEVQEMFKKFDASLNVETNIPKHFDYWIGNVINQVTFGYRFEGEREHEFEMLKEIIDYQNKKFDTFVVFLKVLIPKLGKFLPGPDMDELIDTFKKTFHTFFNQQIENHRKEINFDSDQNSDYVEAYLKEQRKREASGDVESFSNIQLTNMCLDLWFAGFSTTTTTISWAFAYLLNYPKVQEKIHEELQRVVGNDRLITMADKNHLPYMSAFLNETQRCANILPINLMHMTTKDTTINGFLIKKGTGVIAQIGTVMMDEKVFPQPNLFNPDRFIENGTLRKVDELIPFSIGKRQCLGKGLATMELFLFVSNFLNRYYLKPSNEGLPSIDKSNGFQVLPRIFNAIIVKK